MSSQYISKENESEGKSLPTSSNKDTYARRAASLNAEAALKCLTEASKRMSPSTRAYFSRKRTSQDDTNTITEINLPNFGKLTPTTACNDSPAVRSLRFDSSSSLTTRALQRNSKSKKQNMKVKPKVITKTITVPQDFFVRRTANLNASACMSALLSPTKKAKVEESNNSQNYAVIVPAQEDVEVDVVDVDPTDNTFIKVLKPQVDRKTVEPKVTEVVTKTTTVGKPLSIYKTSDFPTLSSPIVSKTSLAVPDKTLLVPKSGEAVKRLVEEGIQLIEKTVQRRPSKLSRRVRT